MEGFLTTQTSSVVKKWIRRYYLCDESALRWYKMKDSKCMGSLPLKDIDRVQDTTNEKYGRMCCFEILLRNNKVVPLYADNDEEKSAWISCLRALSEQIGSKIDAEKVDVDTILRAVKDGDVVREGYMLKEGLLHRTFKRRYFVLIHKYLFYFVDRDAWVKRSKPRGCVTLDSFEMRNVEGMRQRVGCFSLRVGNRVFYLQASSTQDMQGWISSLSSGATEVVKVPVKASDSSSVVCVSSMVKGEQGVRIDTSTLLHGTQKSLLMSPQQMLDDATMGHLFLKHVPHEGKPHKRFVNFEPTQRQIQWRVEHATSPLPKKCVPVCDVIALTAGCESELLQRAGDSADIADLCFSIHYLEGEEVKTLDLQTTSRTERDRWLKVFNYAIVAFRCPVEPSNSQSPCQEEGDGGASPACDGESAT